MATLMPVSPCSESPPQSVIQNAFLKLEEALYCSDIQLFRSTTLQDVREAAKIISRDQAQRRCLQNLRRLEPFFEALGKFAGAIETLCQGTPYLCYVWAPVKLLLQIGDEYLKGFAQLLDAYEQIAQHLPRFERLGALFYDKPEFHSILADTYADILEFHFHAYKFLRRRGWKHLFDASWRSFGSRFNAILQSLDRNRDLVDKEADSFDILESKAFRHRLYEDVARREAETRDWQLRDTLTWLDLRGQDQEQEELFECRSKARLDGTCEWILRNPKISTWLDEHDRRLFVWLRGKPGSGKTTLAVYLKEQALLPPKSMILYCLCSYGFGKQENNACGLAFRSLIAQLLRNRADLLPQVYDNYVKIGAIPKLGTIRDLLKGLLRCLDTTYILLDGLDECEGSHQKLILTELSNLALANSEEVPVKLKILVCSRDTKDIARKLNKAPLVSLTSEDRHVSQDIALFTQHSLTELKDKFDDNIVEEIGKAVVRKAGGMFLWVHLVIKNIVDQESIQDVRRAVDLIPAGLPGVYENILTRLRSRGDEKQQLRAERILGWLAFACRPLKAWEICDGLVFHEGKILNEETKLGAGVLDICKPLIEERDNETIALVHFSAREFLLHKLSGPYISHFRVHADITVACLRFLLTCSPLISAVVSGPTDDHIVKGFYDLFPYVHEFWPDHLLNYSKALHAHSGEQKRIEAVHDLLWMLSSYQTYSAHKVLNPSSGGAVVEDNTVDGESSVLHEFPPAVRNYIAHRKKTPVKQASSASGTDCNSDLTQSDLNWISVAYRTFQTEFESLLSAANSLSYHQMKALFCQMTANSDNVHKFKIRHSKSAFLCRWSGCIWASAGFQTIAEREKHETMHTQRFRCSDPSCEFAENGFSSRHALKKHTLKYHTRAEDLVLPPFPIQKNRSDKTSEDSYTRAHVQGYDEIKTSQISPYLQGPFDEDGLENFNFDAFLNPPDDSGLRYGDLWGISPSRAQNKETVEDSHTTAHTQGPAEIETGLPNPHAQQAKKVPPETRPDERLQVPIGPISGQFENNAWYQAQMHVDQLLALEKLYKDKLRRIRASSPRSAYAQPGEVVSPAPQPDHRLLPAAPNSVLQQGQSDIRSRTISDGAADADADEPPGGLSTQHPNQTQS